MKEVGGYFGLELPGEGTLYHTDSLAFQSGRSALYFILRNVGPSRVWVPYFTCDALLEPLDSLEIPYVFYALTPELEIAHLPELQEDELLIYINYFDLKLAYAEELSERYGDRLIVDCTLAYFTKGNGRSWFFNSTRKFFGVPDGADLYTPERWNLLHHYERLDTNTLYSFQHLLIRHKSSAQEGYRKFLENEELVGMNYDRMSQITQKIMRHVDFEEAIGRRRENFRYVHRVLGEANRMIIEEPDALASHYPYFPHQLLMKKELWAHHFYIPVFWQECLTRSEAGVFGFEKELAAHLTPIPVDHRYTPADLEPLLNKLLQHHGI